MNRIPLSVALCCLALSPLAKAANAVVLGWNNLGMHCMDSSYSEFSILPPYNTIEAHLIVGGKLVKAGTGYTLSYQAIADPDGSINTTSVGKGNWADFAPIIYGAPFSADQGLAGWNMPGRSNLPQRMLFENYNAPAPGVSTLANWFRAEGIPITPYDDAGRKNPYPMMRITARDPSNNVIATSDIVLPVSDEMDCRLCHGASTQSAAMPTGGWITDANKDREYRLNILKLHDDREFANHHALYAEALAAKGFNAAGLYATTMGGRPMLCAACHSSEALGTAGFSSSSGNGKVPALTASVHTKHASVMDPVSNITLNDSNNRSACYRCHPGSDTRCLRGTMGNAIASDGSMAMQCQSCHGNMAQVGSNTRVGWLMEPKCQSCHTGTALKNNGAIRYTTVFDATGAERAAADNTFATTPNTPAAGISLYRFSVGHGGLQCSACHGSTHAEFPASHRNDNIRNIQLQGHAGVMAECTACHTSMPTTISGGPHGMHPLGQDWVNNHHDAVSKVGLAACQTCHGVDFKGTVLSRVQGQRSFTVGDLGKQSFYRGATIGCYTCHQGPTKSDMNWKAAPAIANVSAQTTIGVPLRIPLPGNVAGITLRIISQAQNGSVGLVSGTATYSPYPGFSGTDSFTFSAYDGAKNSALATATVVVNSGPLASGTTITIVPLVDPAPVPSSGDNEDEEEDRPVLVAPVIVGQPVSQTVRTGASVGFYVSGTGTRPFRYQWSRNGVDIAGATQEVLRLSKVTASSSGDYRVRISNAVGSVSSNMATLVVQTPPVITIQPSGVSVLLGAPVTLGVTATGPGPMTYQWFKDLQPIPDANTASLAIPSAQFTDSGAYTVTVANAFGSATSKKVNLAVKAPRPTISLFSPSSGSVGTQVTITGANLAEVKSVAFNGKPAVYTQISDTQITAIVPSGAGSGKISIACRWGTVTSSGKFVVR